MWKLCVFCDLKWNKNYFDIAQDYLTLNRSYSKLLKTLDIDLVRSYSARNMYFGSTGITIGPYVAEIMYLSPYLVNMTLIYTTTMTSQIASASKKTYNLISTSSKSNQYLLGCTAFCFGLTPFLQLVPILTMISHRNFSTPGKLGDF